MTKRDVFVPLFRLIPVVEKTAIPNFKERRCRFFHYRIAPVMMIEKLKDIRAAVSVYLRACGILIYCLGVDDSRFLSFNEYYSSKLAAAYQQPCPLKF